MKKSDYDDDKQPPVTMMFYRVFLIKLIDDKKHIFFSLFYAKKFCTSFFLC